jgi:hypothetical protein
MPTRITLTCPECATSFVRPVEGDEDGRYAVLATEPCHDETCARHLCPCCPGRFVCDACGLTFCSECIGFEDDPPCECLRMGVDGSDASRCLLHGVGQPQTVLYCRACAMPHEAVERIPPRMALEPAGDAEAAA